MFKLAPPSEKDGKWTEKWLHRFNGKDGSNPAAGVILDGSGNLYGTTCFGPPDGYGLIFALKKASGTDGPWTEATLHLFTDRSDGSCPKAGLVFDAGELYGTASAGGDFGGGDVFRLKQPGSKAELWDLSVLHGFAGHTDGAYPAAVTVFNNAGDIYSTTQIGGTGTGCQYGGCGTVFQVSP